MVGLVETLWAERGEHLTNYGFRKHVHNFHQLFYVTHGVGYFKLNGHSIILSPNMYLLVRPFEEHELEIIQKDKLEVLDVKFRIIDDTLFDYLSSTDSWGVCKSGQIKKMLDNIIREGLQKETLYKELTSSYLYTVLLLIIRNSNAEIDSRTDFLQDTPQDSQGVSSIISKYINEHYMEPVNLDKIARQVGYNKYYLCQAFKQKTGYTIGEYIQYIRVEKAKEHLTFSDYNLKQISEILGFGTIEQFTKIFKKFTNHSPGKYRKVVKGEASRFIPLTDNYSNVDYSYHSKQTCENTQ